MLRLVSPNEREEIYKMEYKEWKSNLPFSTYMKECEKDDYRGERFVYINDQGTIVSSLMLYHLHTLSKKINFPVYGIAFVMTKPKHRKKGYAKKMIQSCISSVQAKNNQAVFLLHSEVNPTFYESLSFRTLPYHLQQDAEYVSMMLSSDEQFEQVTYLHSKDIPLDF